MPKILFFPFYGPSRRSSRRVVEFRLDFSADKGAEFPQQTADIRKLLIEANVLSQQENFPVQPSNDERMIWYSSLLLQTALLLQRKTGHRVDFFSVTCEPEQQRCIALMEHEDSVVGMAAARFAIEIFSGRLKNLREPYRQFSEFAKPRALPLETAAIIAACRDRNIPFLQLEREPLAGRTKFANRIRSNGMLSLGQGRSNLVLDGTFCVTRNSKYLAGLMESPGERKKLLQRLGNPQFEIETGNNRLYRVLVINGKAMVLHEAIDGTRRIIESIHASLVELLHAISKQVDEQPVLVSVRAADIKQPLAMASAVVLDFELAPDLHKLFATTDKAEELLRFAVGNLLDHLFPEPERARIPVLAVTGTNGKTTTSRMISHVFQNSGYKPGLVCTDGIFLDQLQVSKGDGSAFVGHARALASTQIDVAVLEAHHRGIAVRGFAFDYCNIAVCLNVTGDHLIKGEIETLEEMTTIKRALLEHARDAAVLNADDLQCLSMLPFLNSSSVCLFSSSQAIAELLKIDIKPEVYCYLENHEDEAWVVIHHAGESRPIMSVASMPCTFAGAARFNLENALAAISACYLAGISEASIASAMRLFSMSYENTPGRLNYHENLPFTAIVDYAHNPDGIARLSEFVAALPVKGRRLIMLAGPGDRSDEGIGDVARAAAGKFDHYVCRHYSNTRGRGPDEVPNLLRAAFLEAGVTQSAISIETDSARAIDRILEMAEPSDLVVLTVDHKEFESTNRRLFAISANVQPGSIDAATS